MSGYLITIADGMFIPGSVGIKLGAPIEWKNADNKPHTVTSDTGLFDSGPILPNGSFAWMPEQPGNYTYTCMKDTNMHGSILVEA